MLQSKLFSKTSKQFPKEEKAINARLLIKGGFVSKLMAGVYSFLPLGLRVKKKIENMNIKVIEVFPGASYDMLKIPRKDKKKIKTFFK